MPSAKYTIPRKCPHCGNTFLAKQIDTIYCSHRCSQAARRKRERENRQLATWNKSEPQIKKGQKYLTVAQCVSRYKVTKSTLYRLIKSHGVEAINFGSRLIRVSDKEMSRLFDKRESPAAEKTTATKKNHFNMAPERCYSIGEITKIYGMSEKQVYANIRRLSIPMRQIGRFVYVPKEEIDNIFNGKVD